MRIIDKINKEEFTLLVENGANRSFLASKYNCSVRTISYILRELELNIKSTLSKIDKEPFKTLILNGKTNDELAAYFNCSKGTIQSAKKKYNLLNISPNSKKIDRENELKVCSICNKELSLDNFYSNGRYKSGKIKYKPSCIECSKIIIRNNYMNKLLYLLESANIEYKCSICGYNKSYSALDFHHTNPANKEFEISNFSKTASMTNMTENLIPEIKKCIILCANCHREEHNNGDTR